MGEWGAGGKETGQKSLEHYWTARIEQQIRACYGTLAREGLVRQHYGSLIRFLTIFPRSIEGSGQPSWVC